MSREGTVNQSLSIIKDNLDYRSKQGNSFNFDVSIGKGPSPGAITVTGAGTDVDFSELTTPAVCRITNLDDTDFVEYGIYDSVTGELYLLGEVLPGETWPFRLSRNLGSSISSGTAIVDTGHTLRIVSNNGPVNVLVEAFDA